MTRDTDLEKVIPPQTLGKWKDGLRRVVRQTRMLRLAMRHPGVPWPAKLVAACSLGYLFSPLQLIPSFIPILGQLDDLAVLYAGAKFLTWFTPREVVEECQAQSEFSNLPVGELRSVSRDDHYEVAL